MADEAIARAKEHDEYYRRTGKLVGPLVSLYTYPLKFITARF